MTEPIITPAQAEALARELFLELHPAKERWFELAWELCVKQPSGPVSAPALQRVLAGSGPAASSDRELIRDLVWLVDSLVQKHPILRSELLNHLQARGPQHGQSPAVIGRTIQSAESKLDKPPDLIAWIGNTSIPQPEAREFTRASGDAWHRKHAIEHDLVIQGLSVFYRSGDRLVLLPLELRFYRLLVMLLRYRGQPLPIKQCFFKAWRGNIPVTHPEEKEITERYLKPAMRDLRSALEKQVPGFNIPHKQRDLGYLCEGNFSFLMMLPGPVEHEFRLQLE